jgi:ubiquitin-activating enzyme E1
LLLIQDNPAVVTVHDESRHGLEDGDQVIFDEVAGMTELNSAKPVKVTVTGTQPHLLYANTPGYCTTQPTC